MDETGILPADFRLGVIFRGAATDGRQTAPAAERQKIESLIKQVGDLKDAKFIRNGSTYQVSSAVRFLRGKWDANADDVKSARDFIERVASASGTSGKPYLIRFKDGREIRSREYLLAELQKLEP
jgi:hypothetical protein